MAGPSEIPWPVIGKLIGALVAAGVLTAGLLLPYVGGLGLAARHEAAKFLDTTCNLTETPPPERTTLLANDGKTVIATLFSQDRHPVPLNEVPQQLQDALVATEDRRFFSHHGVDMRGLIRSAVSTSGGDTQGGSTLTMQYVKQIRYYQAGKDIAKQQAAVDQNLNRKIEDAQCAIQLEKRETKTQILDNYLNIAFFGENSYGIDTAAQNYFGKTTSQLTLPESAMLVGLLRAPTEYDPFQHPEAAKARRNEVLQNLVDVGKLSQAEANKYTGLPVKLATTKPPTVKQGCANANSTIANVGFFCDYAVNWLETTGKITDTQLTTGGLKIVTTLDAGLQNSMQQQVQARLPADSPMTSVLPAVDPKTGNVLAMATSKLYGVQTSTKDISHTVLPLFTEYSGQGASTYKLFPLLTALGTGVPSNWVLGTDQTKYTPSNCATDAPAFNGDAQENYTFNETLTSAAVKSSNTFFVGLADQLLGCNLQPIIDLAHKLGMKGLDQPSGDGNLTIAQTITQYQRANELVLGDVGTSPLELAGAYAAVADLGRYNEPAPILSITDQQGHAIAVNRSPGSQVIAPQVALQAIAVLSGDTTGYPGTSATAFQQWYSTGGSVVAGKTGTSVAVVNNQDTAQNASLWFVGMTPGLVAASALINFDHPNAPAAGLPGVADPATQAYGSYASGIWASALAPTLGAQRWSWPSPAAAPGNPVPPITGMDMATAKATLAAAGYSMQQLGDASTLCPSTQPLGKIAFYGPQIAPGGSTITVCPSSGVGQTQYIPPVRTVPIPPRNPAPAPTQPAPPPSQPAGTVTTNPAKPKPSH